MSKFHPKNERIKRRYCVYLRDAVGLSEQSIDAVAKALDRFESYTGHKDFAAYHFEQARAFKKYILEQRSERTGELLSKATLYSTLMALKKFFCWLAGQSGYRSKLTYADADYFSLPEKDVRVARATRERQPPTPEQILHTLRTMPSGTEIEQRDRTLVAFIYITGVRDGAAISLKLRHIDVDEECVDQDARVVKTKFSKSFTSFFFPVGDDVRQIVADWIQYLLNVKHWGLDDPLFPATKVEVGPDHQFCAVGLDRKHWSTTAPVREIFKGAFARAGLPYFNPHSFRNTLAIMAGKVCKTPEEYKIWSQNLGHEKPITTLLNYGKVPIDQQGEVLRNLTGRSPNLDGIDLIEMGRELIRAGQANSR